MPQALEQLSRPMQREASRQVEQIAVSSMVDSMYEQACASVTSTVLQNAGALCELAEHLCRIAPSGAACYQHIFQAYALRAARTINRW
jgi:hypothetical protein